MASAVLVQMNGFGWSLWALMKAAMSVFRSATLRWMPRLICLSASSANQRSTWFSHEALVGVKCR
jgi:hypothetical protein